MPVSRPPETLNTDNSDLRYRRFESAWLSWRKGEPIPDWRRHLPEIHEPCSREWICSLLQVDIECRVKGGLPALLSERYFEHPRLQSEDARLDDAQQIELIRWEYHQRWQNGERPQRSDYQSAFPRHADAVRELKPQAACPRCRRTFEMDETAQTIRCPHCDTEDSLPTSPPFVPPVQPPPESSPSLDPRAYQLIDCLGKGGMGAVYRAIDPGLERHLAIKVINDKYRGHAEVERRFLREARITGSLQHPGIVPIHNLGRLADGRLHYTMRLVRGRTFADILKEEAGRSEHWSELLTIFVKICQAVAYAHSKRVIHRDLKPANVMVGQFGEVQVMDWGLAKLLPPDKPGCISSTSATDDASTRIPTEPGGDSSYLTRAGAEMGTPAFMPPEQARGEWDMVDERADVFALGAILCEILTGAPPYVGRDGDEVFHRAKCGEVAEATARLAKCGADAALTALCRECLGPEREDRPRDAGVVAQRVVDYQAEVQARLRRAEVERAEADVRAREESKRRRRTRVFAVLLSITAALGVWLAVRATHAEQNALESLAEAKRATDAERQAKSDEANQRQRAEEQKGRAEANAQKAEKSAADTKTVLGFFQDKVLSAGRPQGQGGGLGKDVKLREVVDQAAGDIADSFADRPTIEASIRDTLGMTYWCLGAYEPAIEQHQRALALRETQLGADRSDTLISRNNLALAYKSAGRIDDAIRLFEQTVQQYKANSAADVPEMIRACNNLADTYHVAGRIADSLRLHEENLQLSKAKLGGEHPVTFTCGNNLANALWSSGRRAEALRLYEQTLRQREAKLGTDHPDTLMSRNNLAFAYQSLGRLDEAIRLHQRNLKLYETKLGNDHPDTLRSRNNLAMAYQGTHRSTDALRLYERNLPLYEKKLGADHPDTLSCRNNVAEAYGALGRKADSIRLHEQNLKSREGKFGIDHPDTLLSRNNLAIAYDGVGRTADAIRLHEQNLSLSEAKLGVDHPTTLLVMVNLGSLYRRKGQLKKAIPLLESALARGRRRPDGLPGEFAQLPVLLAQSYERVGEPAKAESIYRDVLADARKQFGVKALRTAGPLALLGGNLLRQKNFADAEVPLRQCLALLDQKLPDSWMNFHTRSVLGEALAGQKKYGEAEPLLVQGYKGMKQRRDKIPPSDRQRQLTDALRRLVQLYEAWGKKDKADDWRNRIESVDKLKTKK